MKKKSTSPFGGSILCVLFVITVTCAQGQVRLVKDIDTSSKTSSEAKVYSFHEGDGTRSFFVANEGEFWTSDGTTAGTKILRRFLAISEMEVIGGICFLNVLTEDHGAELWRSNGTASGTVLLKDIYPGRGSSSPLRMVNVNGTLFFSANHPVYGRELWKSDGTAAGTQLVKDIVPGGQASLPRLLVKNGNKVFFIATTLNEGQELWSSDGTPTGTVLVKDIFLGPGSSVPNDLTASNGWVFFSASHTPASRQLWKSDGTAAGTTLVKEINPGSDAKIGRMIDVQGLVFFQAYEPAHGLELWRSDGTDAGTFLLKDITPGPGSAAGYAANHLDRFASIDGKLVFTAEAEDPRVWISDGTPAGTKQAVYPGGQPYLWGLPSVVFYEINGSAYFRASNESNYNLYKVDMAGNMYQVRRNLGGDLFDVTTFSRIGALHYFISGDYYWRTDGTSSGTTPIRTLGVPSGSDPSDFVDINGTLHFSRTWPAEIWKSNGTEATTAKVLDVDFLVDLARHNELLLIYGRMHGDPAYSLYRSDGTAAGTYLLAPELRFPENFTAANNQTFFSGYSSGWELWRTDGTPGGTATVLNVSSGMTVRSPANLTTVGNHLYFTANDLSAGNELFRTNEVNEAYVVKDIFPGTGSSQPRNLVSFKGKLFFQANDGVNGHELWQSNGSNALTTMVKDIRTNDSGESSPDLGAMIATNDYLYFSALNEEGNMSLWKSDGTAGGTVQVMNFSAATQFPEILGSTGAQAFFMVKLATHMELWKVNGTSAVRLANFRNQSFFGYPSYEYLHYDKVAVKNNTVYFITELSPQSYLWRTDGTFGGTYQIPFDGRPQEVYTSGAHVYLSGISQKEGYELFVIEEATSAAMERLVAIENEEEDDVAIKNFPNPFENTFKLMVPGAPGEKFLLNVIDMQGRIVSFEDNIPCNTELQIGASWKAGMYVLQVRQNDRMAVRKVVKGKL